MDIYPGWWFQPTPLKNHRQLVSWDDDIPFPINMMNMESHKKNPWFQSTPNQIRISYSHIVVVGL
jgi:hypothetical protein